MNVATVGAEMIVSGREFQRLTVLFEKKVMSNRYHLQIKRQLLTTSMCLNELQGEILKFHWLFIFICFIVKHFFHGMISRESCMTTILIME